LIADCRFTRFQPISSEVVLNEPSKMAAELSPGRKPGVGVEREIQPAKRATENESDQNIPSDIGHWPCGVVRFLAQRRFHSII
jgi:hypothetical protein